jgi:hypothetical protein
VVLWILMVLPAIDVPFFAEPVMAMFQRSAMTEPVIASSSR